MDNPTSPASPASPASPESIASAVRTYGASRRLKRELEARWLAWAPTDAAALLELAEALGLGGNQIADFLTWLEEISARDDTGPAAVLAAHELRGVMRSELGRSDKLKRVKALLRARRYPRLAALEKALDAEVRALGLGGQGLGLVIRFPPGLEGDEITVELRARRPDALRDAVARLDEAIAGGAFDRMFELLDEAS